MSDKNKSTEATVATLNSEEQIAALRAEIEALKAQVTTAKKSSGPRIEKVEVPGMDQQVSAKFVRQMETLIALGESGDSAFPTGDGFVVGPHEIIAAGWSRCYSTITNGWTRKKTAGLAARVCGYKTRAKVQDGEVWVVFHKIEKKVEAEEVVTEEEAAK